MRRVDIKMSHSLQIEPRLGHSSELRAHFVSSVYAAFVTCAVESAFIPDSPHARTQFERNSRATLSHTSASSDKWWCSMLSSRSERDSADASEDDKEGNGENEDDDVESPDSVVVVI